MQQDAKEQPILQWQKFHICEDIMAFQERSQHDRKEGKTQRAASTKLGGVRCKGRNIKRPVCKEEEKPVKAARRRSFAHEGI